MTLRASPALRLFVAAARRIAKPFLARTAGPIAARRAFERMARAGLRRPPFLVHLTAKGSPPIHWISCGQPRQRGVILYFHGGGYVAGSPETHAGLVGRLSRLSELRVAVPAYRLAPEHPAPAAFEDARAAHAALLARGYRPDEIALAGDSAGGGLALALLSDLCARGLRPACVVGFSPWTDLSGASPSLHENAARDPILPVKRLDELVGFVTGGLSPADPRLSPLHADFDAPPPVLLMVGSTEILRDDSVRMARHLRAAGGAVRLEIWPDAPHAWPLFDGYLPEARDALRAAAAFILAPS